MSVPRIPAAALFAPLTIQSVTRRNRIAVSPMCQYSSVDGFASDWRLVHLGSRAVGGAGLVIAEATAVEARGRITPSDLGIWKDEHIPHPAPGTAAGSLPKPGRMANRRAEPAAFPAVGRHSARTQREEIAGIVEAFAVAAKRALEAGFRVVELHGAHGYLLHEFLSPLSNARTDQYGGSFGNRTRLILEVAGAVRSVWPAELPLFTRLSCTDWTEGGWTEDDSVEIARRLPFAERIRREAGIATGAVGLITDPREAESIVAKEQADIVLLAREMLRHPYWSTSASRRLHTLASLGI
jgi:2,4-dienoyl-CoA reductase-like NADH-dependent reductase (Old Yellow Enzyme family)